jgi:hypothetical protein
VSLPSGLGAGGRGKEKAPCRYLHFEVDWDGADGEEEARRGRGGGREVVKRPPYRLGIGMGPDGKDSQVVRSFSSKSGLVFHDMACSFLLSGSTATYAGLIIRYWANSTLSWLILLGIFT